MLSKAHFTSHSRMSGSRWVITPLWVSGSWRSFFYSSSVYSCHLFLISPASVRSISTYKATKGICIRVTDSRLAQACYHWLFFGLETCRTLVPQPVFKSMSPALEDWSLHHGALGHKGSPPLIFKWRKRMAPSQVQYCSNWIINNSVNPHNNPMK